YDLTLQAAPDDERDGRGGGGDDGEPAGDGTAVKAQDADTSVIRMDRVAGGGQVQARDLAPAEQPRLVCLSGGLLGKELPLRRTAVRIGRTEENDLSLDHPSVSRQHCLLFREGETWKILDRRSTQ